MKKVVLYSTDHCPHCQNAKQYFTAKNIAYRLSNIKTPAGQKEFYRLGFKSVPVIKIGEEFLQGFNIKAFQRLYC